MKELPKIVIFKIIIIKFFKVIKDDIHSPGSKDMFRDFKLYFYSNKESKASSQYRVDEDPTIARSF